MRATGRHKKLDTILFRLVRGRSIRSLLILPSILQAIFTLAVAVMLLLAVVQGGSQPSTKTLHQQTMQYLRDQLAQRMRSAMQLDQLNGGALQAGLLNLNAPAARHSYFANQLACYPDVMVSFIGLSDGSFYGARRGDNGEIQAMDGLPGFDPRQQPWYTKAADAGEPVFIDASIHPVFQKSIITATYPVYDSARRLIGVFGMGYPLSWLGETLGSLPTGVSEEGFIIDSTGLLVTSSFGGATQLLPAAESDNPLIRATLALRPDTHVSNLPLQISAQGKQYNVVCSDLQEYGNNWTIYVLYAQDDVSGGANRILWNAVLILCASTLLCFLFTVRIARQVARPIATLSKAMQDLARGRLRTVHDGGREDELGALNRSFNEMSQHMINLVSDLEKEVALRTRQLQERNEELQRLSFTDGLTGIANRRQFDSALRTAWNTALRACRSLAVFMMDIDRFKLFNDTYGHQAGDDCVKAIGNVLKANVRRSTELAARYGGEEFVIILQDTTIERARDLAERIRKSVYALNIEHALSPHRRVTVSIGCAYTIPHMGAQPEALVAMADQALYQAKEDGRNRVVFQADVLPDEGERVSQ